MVLTSYTFFFFLRNSKLNIIIDILTPNFGLTIDSQQTN